MMRIGAGGGDFTDNSCGDYIAVRLPITLGWKASSPRTG